MIQDKDGRKMKDGEILKRLFKYALEEKGKFILALFLSFIVVVLDVVLPLMIGFVIDLLSGRDISISFLNHPGEYWPIIVIVVCYLVCILLIAFINYKQTLMLQKAGQNVMYNIREEVFMHLETLSIEQLNEVPVGKLVTRVTNDTNAINIMYTRTVINLIRSCLAIILVLTFMFLVNWILALYVLAVCPLVIVFSIIFRKFSRKAYREVRGNNSEMNGFLSENIYGMKITQIFNQEEKKAAEFDKKNSDLKKSGLKEMYTFAIFRPSIYVLYLAATILVLYFGAKSGMEGGAVTGATVIVFYQYVSKFFDPIQQLADQFNVLQSAFASGERIFEVLDTKPLIVDSPDAIELESFKGSIEFKNVWFYYKEGEWVLKDVSFKIEANQTCAFVGATGSGKTTILGLIVRNYDIQKGEILIDGVNIQNIKIASLRKNIGQMLQDVFLFSGTVLSNIRMRDESISLDEVKEACDYVNATNFINNLPKRFNEPVRERGNNFSAGQRQLLSFARAVVHKTRIMILDEATANIDTETEILIQNSLENMMNIGTMLIVAHRLSTIQHADNIILLKHGEIVEQGNHQELLHKKGQYYNLYRLQFAKEELK